MLGSELIHKAYKQGIVGIVRKDPPYNYKEAYKENSDLYRAVIIKLFKIIKA